MAGRHLRRQRPAAPARRRPLCRAASALARGRTASRFCSSCWRSGSCSRSTSLVGAIRWIDGRPAINNHARTHLGWLLAASRCSSDVGIPARAVRAARRTRRTPRSRRSGGRPAACRRSWRAWRSRPRCSPPSGRSAAAARPRRGRLDRAAARFPRRATGWCRPPWAGTASPPAERPGDRPARAAWPTGSRRSREERCTPDGPPAPPRGARRSGTSPMIGHMAAADSAEGGRDRPGGADGPGKAASRSGSPCGSRRTGAPPSPRWRTTARATRARPLFYSAERHACRGWTATALLDLGPDAFRPDAPPYRFETGDAARRRGGRAGRRRVMLAWALQARRAVGRPAAGLQGGLAAVAIGAARAAGPVRSTGASRSPRIVNGELVWLARRLRRASRLSAQHPDAVARARNRRAPRRLPRHSRGRRRARPGSISGPVPMRSAAAWAAIAQGVVEPASAIPEVVLRAAPYPVELFRVQARQLEQRQPAARQPRRAARLAAARSCRPRTVGWSEDTTGPVPDGDLRARRRAARSPPSSPAAGAEWHGRASAGPLRLRHRAAEPQRAGEPLEPLPILRRPERFDRGRRRQAGARTGAARHRHRRAGGLPVALRAATREAASRSPG